MLEPAYASAVTFSGDSAAVGGGGLAFGNSLQPGAPRAATWTGQKQAPPKQEPKLSVNATELEREAWLDLARALKYE